MPTLADEYEQLKRLYATAGRTRTQEDVYRYEIAKKAYLAREAEHKAIQAARERNLEIRRKALAAEQAAAAARERQAREVEAARRKAIKTRALLSQETRKRVEALRKAGLPSQADRLESTQARGYALRDEHDAADRLLGHTDLHTNANVVIAQAIREMRPELAHAIVERLRERDESALKQTLRFVRGELTWGAGPE